MTSHELPLLARDAIFAWLKSQRWFGGKGRAIETLRVGATIPIGNEGRHALRLLHVDFAGSEEEIYWTAWPTNWRADESRTVTDVPAELIDKDDFLAALWEECVAGKNSVWRHPDWRPVVDEVPPAMLATFEQSNTCVLFRPNDAAEPTILKLYRKLTPGVNPDAELGRYLSEQPNPVTPPVRAVLEIPLGSERATLGILSRFLPGCRTGWEVLLEVLTTTWKVCLEANVRLSNNERPNNFALENEQLHLFNIAIPFGVRTAQLHNDLAKGAQTDFQACDWNAEDLAILLRGMTEHAKRQLAQLRQLLVTLKPSAAKLAKFVLDHEDELISKYSAHENNTGLGKLIRIHGDYHLGQILVAVPPPFVDELGLPTYDIEKLPNEFWIIDFEGEPSRSLTERLAKRSPLQDVAGMIRSFHYALCVSQYEVPEQQTPPQAARRDFDEIAAQLSKDFLDDYRRKIVDKSLIPLDDAQFQKLLDLFILDKALYELGYELNNRPDWVWVPLTGIAGLLNS